MNHYTSRLQGRLLSSSVIRDLACALSLTLALGMGTAHAVTITVNSSADGELGDLPDQCTLRAAVASANDGPAVDGCASGSFGADEIVFDSALAGTTIVLNAGQIEITNALTITGPLANDPSGIVLDADGQSRVFLIQGSEFGEFEVSLTGLTLTNGNTSGSGDPKVGGAVFLDSADLTLDHVAVANNSAQGGGGGGLAVRNGNLTLTDSLVAFNSATGLGGGISFPFINATGELTVLRSVISNNTGAWGGGVWFEWHTDVSSFSAIDSTFSGNVASGSRGRGGGAFLATSNSFLKNVIITDNLAAGAAGGGLEQNGGTSIMENLTVSGNTAFNGGAGINLQHGEHTITDSTIFGNTIVDGGPGGGSSRGGAGIAASNADVTIRRTSIHDNILEDPRWNGGGLSIQLGALLVTESTINGNSNIGPFGGGIFAWSTSVTLVNSTVSGNTTTGTGGGMFLNSSVASLIHTTVFDNHADDGARGIAMTNTQPITFPDGFLALENSLVVQTSPGDVACQVHDEDQFFTSMSLATDPSCTGAVTSLSDLDIAPLADNGGPTLTHALGSNSVAIEAAGDCVSDFGIDNDQRGFQRPGFDSSSCDIGAFEFQNLFTVSGTVSGLAGSGLVLQNNGEDDLAIASDGSFTFANTLTNGSNYNVEVLDYPVEPLQSCSLANAAGTIDGADVTDVAVECETGFTVGGTVTGLALPGLVLDLNGGSMLLFDVDNDYAFPRPLPDGAEYQVTVELAPDTHDCQTANATGTITGADVVDADVACATDILFADGLETLQPDPVELN